MTDMEEMVDNLLQEADQRVLERRTQGAEKYGHVTFLDYDNLQQALDEVVDLINYARFAYVKLRLLQMGLRGEFQTDGSTAKPTGPDMPGKHEAEITTQLPNPSPVVMYDWPNVPTTVHTPLEGEL